jgi:hypothetical protein
VEEKRLFVKMSERGLPLSGGPLAVMLHEHEEGRRLIRAAADALPLAAAFARVAAEETDARVHEKYHKLAEELAGSLEEPSGRGAASDGIRLRCRPMQESDCQSRATWPSASSAGGPIPIARNRP